VSSPFLVQLYYVILTLQLDQFLGSRSGAFASAIIYTNAYSLELKGVAVGATIVFIAGLIDDIVCLRARLKLLIQIIAVSIMIYYGVVADFLPNVWWDHTLEIAITFI